MERHVFRAMGTDVEILLDTAGGADALLALSSVEREFERLESILSRFRPDSQLSRLNELGWLATPDPDLVEVMALAFAGRERTSGLFDPTVHDALVAAGYDRSFELLGGTGGTRSLREGAGGGFSPAAPAPDGGRGPCSRGRHLTLPDGRSLDLGGIGKGYAVDRAAGLLAPLGPCLVNAGGDLAVGGAPRVWPVAVETPLGSVTLGLERGALASSGRDRRSWRAGEEELHHLIDPRTSRPAETTLERVTVAASTAVEAEVTAKAVFLGGRAEAERLAARALLVHADGRAEVTGGLL